MSKKKLTPQEVMDVLKEMFKEKRLTAEEEQKVKDRMDWLVRFLVCRYHFVHKVLGYMERSYSYQMSTMGVRVQGSKMYLTINPAFAQSLSDEFLTFVLYHEVCHIVLHHCTSRQLGRTSLANTAHDLAVNDIIPEEEDACLRPRDKDGNLMGLFVDELKKQPIFADIENMKSSEWYYNYLRKKQKENPQAGEGGGEGDGEGSGETIDEHGGREENEVVGERIRNIVKEIDATNSWGSMSATAQEVIRSAQVRKINWRNKIRTWFGNIAWKHRISTRKRPNRRTGYMHPGHKKSYVDRWLVAADTSMSIDSDLLGQFGGVLNQLVEILPIDFMQFDAGMTAEPKPYDRKMMNVTFKGRGGTDFEPVMKVADERHYKGVMLLTDGCAGEPHKPKAKVLWVMPKGCHAPVEWGERVYLDRGA